MQSRFVRFAPSARWRNIGVYGMLDETRHTQLDKSFSHYLLLKHDEPFDWCQKGFHTNEWGIIAVKNFFDDWMLNADCVGAARPPAWRSGGGRDEVRHAQCGLPVLEVTMTHDPARAQYIDEVSLWRSFRLFQTLTGAKRRWMALSHPMVRRCRRPG